MWQTHGYIVEITFVVEKVIYHVLSLQLLLLSMGWFVICQKMFGGVMVLVLWGVGLTA